MDYAEYIDQGEYVILFRLYGEGSIAEIPGEVAGRPVKVLADHLFAKEPSVQYRAEQIRCAALRGGRYEEVPAGQEEAAGRGASGNAPPSWGKRALAGETIEIIRIPEGVERIGHYAFYGCRRLQEISFPSTLKQIGYGLFSGCRSVRSLLFEAQGDPPILKEILDAVSGEVEAVVTCGGKEEWRLTFPEYYEEGKENTPARIIEIVYHGTGRQYRNCFLNRKIQFDRYDEVFPLAAAQESAQTCLSMIRNRLRGGERPGKERTDRYIEYLRNESALLIREILADGLRDPVDELKCLEENGFFTSKIIDDYISSASAAGRADAVSFLMELKRRRFKAETKRRYEF